VRILLAAHHTSRIAGAETYADTVIAALRRRGHDVALLTEHRAVDGREPIGGAQTQWCTAEAGEIPALERASAWQPHVVYAQGLASVRLERALTRLAPSVLFEHSYAGLCISGSRTWCAEGTECPRTLGPGCLALYFPHRCGGRSPMTMVRDYKLQRARQRLLPAYRAIVVASRHMAEVLATHGCGGRVHVLPPPVPPALADVPRRTGTPLRIVYAGRLERLKGVHLLSDAVHIAAARLGRPIELRIAGDGPLRPVLEQQSRDTTTGVLMFLHGWQTAAQRDALFASADLLIVPSLWPEPFGLVGLEAARFGVPSVAFASGGVPEWLHHGVNGLVAVERTSMALGEAIRAAIEDERIYKRLSAGALAATIAAAPDAHAHRLERLLTEAAR
jgi:glycosyltransferase involved in cell wall biosynthesis